MSLPRRSAWWLALALLAAPAAARADLFVSSFGTNAVLEYNGTTGAFVKSFVPTGGGGLITPTDVTFGPAGPAVPEPSSLLLTGGGLLGVLGLAAARRLRGRCHRELLRRVGLCFAMLMASSYL